jgi:hypothetical protein
MVGEMINDLHARRQTTERGRDIGSSVLNMENPEEHNSCWIISSVTVNETSSGEGCMRVN